MLIFLNFSIKHEGTGTMDCSGFGFAQAIRPQDRKIRIRYLYSVSWIALDV